MDIKDVVEGKRVKVLSDSSGIIPVGAVGTIIENGGTFRGLVSMMCILLNNLLNQINCAIDMGDEETALKLSEAYQRI